MLVHERHNSILHMLHESKTVKVTDFIAKFGVSFETVRRDLEYLEKEGFLKRVHGGATLPASDYRKELSFTVRELKGVNEKIELAHTASQFVSEGQSLFLDVSTTNTEFAKVLMKNFEKLTIITNSFPIASLLMQKSGFTIIFVGGVIRNSEQCVVGDIAEDFISRFRADIFFMSISGISLSEGLTDYGMGEIQLKKKILARSNHVVVLADSSKFDAVSLSHVCGFQDIDRIVTDKKIDPEIVRSYEDQGVEVIY
ncbi:DeoR/GlpR family DNA-binding transcription regulator [Paenibacillus macquariensis]|uniref:Transcriptional regulator, DeoR family n=1 Tax=Paenibacillus macquariensis TaxID=948756 RepID=A0ABY1KC79_9BACL|nr:DeoR/GlpR family DNA-binding transcription regulator [Paenibacillus macquariensis]MEC0089592.1 DeoR/GlpR family DNA-binding transcription regulator [Paenibacillus macquariensis]OAB30916.1 DeoR family transcriptional regulator [Paenibacillus macquariensis subsp. macquariensis]SIR58161.1 transcriptional regulator, DeoR family [Paenibacillus macquariensis]